MLNHDPLGCISFSNFYECTSLHAAFSILYTNTLDVVSFWSFWLVFLIEIFMEEKKRKTANLFENE